MALFYPLQTAIKTPITYLVARFKRVFWLRFFNSFQFNGERHLAMAGGGEPALRDKGIIISSIRFVRSDLETSARTPANQDFFLVDYGKKQFQNANGAKLCLIRLDNYKNAYLLQTSSTSTFPTFQAPFAAPIVYVETESRYLPYIDLMRSEATGWKILLPNHHATKNGSVWEYAEEPFPYRTENCPLEMLMRTRDLIYQVREEVNEEVGPGWKMLDSDRVFWGAKELQRAATALNGKPHFTQVSGTIQHLWYYPAETARPDVSGCWYVSTTTWSAGTSIPATAVKVTVAEIAQMCREGRVTIYHPPAAPTILRFKDAAMEVDFRAFRDGYEVRPSSTSTETYYIGAPFINQLKLYWKWQTGMEEYSVVQIKAWMLWDGTALTESYPNVLDDLRDRLEDRNQIGGHTDPEDLPYTEMDHWGTAYNKYRNPQFVYSGELVEYSISAATRQKVSYIQLSRGQVLNYFQLSIADMWYSQTWEGARYSGVAGNIVKTPTGGWAYNGTTGGSGAEPTGTFGTLHISKDLVANRSSVTRFTRVGTTTPVKLAKQAAGSPRHGTAMSDLPDTIFWTNLTTGGHFNYDTVPDATVMSLFERLKYTVPSLHEHINTPRLGDFANPFTCVGTNPNPRGWTEQALAAQHKLDMVMYQCPYYYTYRVQTTFKVSMDLVFEQGKIACFTQREGHLGLFDCRLEREAGNSPQARYFVRLYPQAGFTDPAHPDRFKPSGFWANAPYKRYDENRTFVWWAQNSSAPLNTTYSNGHSNLADFAVQMEMIITAGCPFSSPVTAQGAYTAWIQNGTFDGMPAFKTPSSVTPAWYMWRSHIPGIAGYLITKREGHLNPVTGDATSGQAYFVPYGRVSRTPVLHKVFKLSSTTGLYEEQFSAESGVWLMISTTLTATRTSSKHLFLPYQRWEYHSTRTTPYGDEFYTYTNGTGLYLWRSYENQCWVISDTVGTIPTLPSTKFFIYFSSWDGYQISNSPTEVVRPRVRNHRVVMSGGYPEYWGSPGIFQNKGGRYVLTEPGGFAIAQTSGTDITAPFMSIDQTRLPSWTPTTVTGMISPISDQFMVVNRTIGLAFVEGWPPGSLGSGDRVASNPAPHWCLVGSYTPTTDTSFGMIRVNYDYSLRNPLYYNYRLTLGYWRTAAVDDRVSGWFVGTGPVMYESSSLTGTYVQARAVYTPTQTLRLRRLEENKVPPFGTYVFSNMAYAQPAYVREDPDQTGMRLSQWDVNDLAAFEQGGAFWANYLQMYGPMGMFNIYSGISSGDPTPTAYAYSTDNSPIYAMDDFHPNSHYTHYWGRNRVLHAKWLEQFWKVIQCFGWTFRYVPGSMIYDYALNQEKNQRITFHWDFPPLLGGVYATGGGILSSFMTPSGARTSASVTVRRKYTINTQLQTELTSEKKILLYCLDGAWTRITNLSTYIPTFPYTRTVHGTSIHGSPLGYLASREDPVMHPWNHYAVVSEVPDLSPRTKLTNVNDLVVVDTNGYVINTTTKVLDKTLWDDFTGNPALPVAPTLASTVPTVPS